MSVSTTCIFLVATIILTVNAAATAEESTNITYEIEGGGPNGVLLVTVNGETGVICHKEPSNAIAVVVCRELGFNTTIAHVTTPLYEYPTYIHKWPVVLDEVYCLGNESSLADCTYTTDIDCWGPIHIGIDCSPELKVKVVNESEDNGNGLLVVNVNGMRGAVCSDGTSFNAVASVVCRELGMESTTAHARIVEYWGKLPSAMSDVYCTGSESRLGECTFLARSSCTFINRIGVYCGEVTSVTEGGGRKGKLIVTVGGRTGEVTSYDSTNALAAAACRGMGWDTSVAQLTAIPKNPSAMMYKVQCKGHEDNLAQCDFDEKTPSWYGTHVAGVDCSAGPRKVTVNIRGGKRGRLVVQIDEQKGFICREKATDALAEVVCRELGFKTTRARIITTKSDSTVYEKLDNVMYNVSCTGTEKSLADCSYYTYGDCLVYNYVAIDCAPEPTVKLSILEGGRRGTLVATVNGKPGVVCRWSPKYYRTSSQGRVACRELGLAVNWSSKLRKLVTPTNLSVVLEDVYCSGGESGWEDCAITVGKGCSSGEVFGITCDFAPTTTLEIQGGGPKGLLLANAGGKTGTVCYSDESRKDDIYHNGAILICRQLGWNTPRPRIKIVRKPTKLSPVFSYDYCYGSETNLAECSEDTCKDEDGYLEVDCSNVPKASIEGGGSRGRLLATVAGQTGRVCSTKGHDALAAVVCRELGFSTSRITRVSGKKNLPIVVDDVHCTGNESKLADCKFTAKESCKEEWDYEIDCSSVPTKVTVAIEGGGDKGRLIATVDGKTGTVCRNKVTHDLAKIVCKELGKNTTTAQIVTVWAPSTLPIVMDQVRCTGEETTLAECKFNILNTCSHIQDVGIDCFPDVKRPVDPCEKNPCQNDGTCVKHGATNFKCLCPPGVSGATCQDSDSCSLSYYNQLTTFAGETAFISVPCAYDLVSMQCGHFNVKVEGRTKPVCGDQECMDSKQTHALLYMDISIKSDDVTFTGKLKYNNFKLIHSVKGEASLVRFTHDISKKKTVVVTSDNVLSLTLSRDDGFKLLCGNMTSSAEYPTSLCGSGSSGKIADKTKSLEFPDISTTVAYDIFFNSKVKTQTSNCKSVTARLEACKNPVEAIRRCSRCFPGLSRTNVKCLKKCLRKASACKESP